MIIGIGLTILDVLILNWSVHNRSDTDNDDQQLTRKKYLGEILLREINPVRHRCGMSRPGRIMYHYNDRRAKKIRSGKFFMGENKFAFK